MQCNICKKSAIEGIKVKDGFICNQCLANCFGVPKDQLYRKYKETKQLESMTIEEITKSVSYFTKYLEQIENEKNETSKKEEESRIIAEERQKAFDEAEKRRPKIVVTTADLKQDYEIIGPIYFQVNNRGNQLTTLTNKYADYLQSLKSGGMGSNDSATGLEILEILFVNAGSYNGHAQFDSAFFVAVEEMKLRAALAGADAIVGLRQDIDLDSNGFQYFYLQMYGTAVKFK